ncbi:MAG TPA: serine/threonine-protein kinase, partial [Blastocatellia bacterium]|nr:serine/threonine-protein kinase [Blastocatellia bacterium]
NVMIDGRGKARITDFGLAGLAGDFQGHEVRAGTPAYMAPEQLAGREVTAKSDIYSLGLVLYEIFTGKKAFDAATLEDLIKQRETTTPPSISDYVKEVDPLVERVILRCLERAPQARPSSVTQVAAALPGGDPLAAAIAAGETPSPEMVAAAPKEGALRPVAAVACLAGIIIQLAFFVLAAGKTAIQNRMPLDKPPEVLAERAVSIINRFGYTEPPVDTAYWFRFDDAYREDSKMKDALQSNVEMLATGQPPVISFRYRQSPRYLEPYNGERVWFTDPPMLVSNMVNLTLDTRGRLIEFNAVPPQVDESQQPTAPFDWTVLFSEAGLDIADFTSSNSTWTAPVSYDARAAWEGACADNPDIPVRIEAAVNRGKPVYFQIVYPWDKPLRQEEAAGLAGRNVAGILITIIFIAGLIGAVLLARRNLKLGRGDRKGALKIVLVAFCCAMLGSLLSADHVPTLGGELSVIYEAASWSLVVVALLWVAYVALEPYVRRRWPRLMISWSRLLSGGWRDPMVGRDILVGGLLGLGHTLAIQLSIFLPRLLGLPSFTGLSFAPDAQGLTSSIAFVSTILPRSIFVGMGFLFLSLLFYVLFRRQWLAASALWLMIFVVDGLAFYSGDPWIAWISPVMIATIAVITVVRFGLLSVVAFEFFFFLSAQRALTSDLSKWFAGETIFVVAVLLGISIYSFYTSLAGQPLFRGQILQD